MEISGALESKEALSEASELNCITAIDFYSFRAELSLNLIRLSSISNFLVLFMQYPQLLV